MRKRTVILCPVRKVFSPYHVLKDEADDSPGYEVDSCRWWDLADSSEDEAERPITSESNPVEERNDARKVKVVQDRFGPPLRYQPMQYGTRRADQEEK